MHTRTVHTNNGTGRNGTSGENRKKMAQSENIQEKKIKFTPYLFSKLNSEKYIDPVGTL